MDEVCQTMKKNYTKGAAGRRLFIKNAAELVTCRGAAPKKGAAMNDLDIIPDGAVIVEDGVIRNVGPTTELVEQVDESYHIIDAVGKCVMPGFIDSHTHLVFAGYRAEEFSWRLRGDTYMEIMEQGGGIANTVRFTRQAGKDELTQLAFARLDAALALGVTSVESKSGYGLDLATEIKQLEVLQDLNELHPVEIVATFMGAHAVPAEYKGRSGAYIDYIIEQMLPVVAERKLAEFCDVFCEKGVFSIDESRRLLNAAKSFNLQPKLHADEIVYLGGAELAAEVGAVSADHLLQVSDYGIDCLIKSNVVATLLPATAFSLREAYARGREMIDRGAAVALASDFNPGSCFTQSIPLLIALAVLQMRLSPAEVITALTINAAAAVGRADRIGSIEPGKQADIIILAYPSHLYLPYYVGTSIVETVIKCGDIVWKK
jgi:imidazolonepropionase